jgi:alpha-galactosidase
MDWAIIDNLIPGHLKTEFGGIAGISYSLRQIALIESLTDQMRGQCPNAWLLVISNPLPRVTQAAHENGVKTAGFCAVALSAYAMLWEIFRGGALSYPFTEGRALWRPTTAGLNHLAWVIGLDDARTGEDLLPELRSRSATGLAAMPNRRSLEFLRETGYLLVPGDEHTRDFLPPRAATPPTDVIPWHGSAIKRRQRLGQLRSVGDGSVQCQLLLKEGEAWEKPLRFIAGLSGGMAAEFPALNLANAGQVTNLPPKVFVETPCRVSSEGVHPATVQLPDAILPVCLRTAHVTDTIVRAARRRSRAILYEAVHLDPTVIDKNQGIAAIDACLTAHADILPAYA